MTDIVRLSGKAVVPYLSEVAQLRIDVFREFPYLYDGDEVYERDYLKVYAKSDRSVIVVALKDGEVVGASTGLPLVEADEAFQRPLVESEIDLNSVFYFGESVLRKSERGQGIGHRFFEERETHASALGFRLATFCAVERLDNHPLKPLDYRTNDVFWIKRGFQKKPHLAAELEWKQIDQPDEVPNRLIFWTKEI